MIFNKLPPFTTRWQQQVKQKKKKTERIQNLMNKKKHFINKYIPTYEKNSNKYATAHTSNLKGSTAG